jgi:hypothetical protein
MLWAAGLVLGAVALLTLLALVSLSGEENDARGTVRDKREVLIGGQLYHELRLDDGHDSAWVSVTEKAHDRCAVGESYPGCAR